MPLLVSVTSQLRRGVDENQEADGVHESFHGHQPPQMLQ